jgi:NADH:ubiquinone oxidoreductase subunit 4 (subunit M)
MSTGVPAILLASCDVLTSSGALICYFSHSWISCQLFLVSDNIYGSNCSRWTCGANACSLALLTLITQAAGFPNSQQCNGEILMCGGQIPHSHAVCSLLTIQGSILISGLMIWNSSTVTSPPSTSSLSNSVTTASLLAPIVIYLL